MKTPIYLKMDAKESLLLSEGMCHQLGIISYHPQVTPGDNHSKEKATSDVLLPAVRVQLVEMVKLKPRESIMAGGRFVGKGAGGQGKWSQPEFMLIETNEQQGLEPGAHIASASSSHQPMVWFGYSSPTLTRSPIRLQRELRSAEQCPLR